MSEFDVLVSDLAALEITGPIDDTNRHLFEDVVEATATESGRIEFKRADGSVVSWMSQETYMKHHAVASAAEDAANRKTFETQIPKPNRRSRRATLAQERKFARLKP